MEGLRGDRTWYTKERAGVRNHIRKVFGTPRGPVRNYLAMTVGTQEGRSIYGLYVGMYSSNASLRVT